MLKGLLAKVSACNAAIKKALPESQIISLEQAIELLVNDFEQKSGYDSLGDIQADLIEQIKHANKILTGF